jgi:hypothetical protein
LDIVKFGTVSFIALAIAAGVALSDLWGRADNRGQKTGCASLIAALLWQRLLYPFGQLSAYDLESRPRFSVQMIRPYFSICSAPKADSGALQHYRAEYRDTYAPRMLKSKR